MKIVEVISERPLSERDTELAMTFAVKSAHQKKQKEIVTIDNKSALSLASSMVHESRSRCLAMVVNYPTAIKMSSIHHVYHKNHVGISNLDILHPIALSKLPFGKIGYYCGVELWHSHYKPLDRFPPLLINSRSDYPIKIFISKKSDQSLAPRNVIVEEETIFANCGKVLESEYRTAMNAADNMEAYKRFQKELNTVIKEMFINFP